jgi:hypothetical protein
MTMLSMSTARTRAIAQIECCLHYTDTVSFNWMLMWSWWGCHRQDQRPNSRFEERFLTTWPQYHELFLQRKLKTPQNINLVGNLFVSWNARKAPHDIYHATQFQSLWVTGYESILLAYSLFCVAHILILIIIFQTPPHFYNLSRLLMATFYLFFPYLYFLNLFSLCGPVIRVPGYRSRNPGFDSRCHLIFWEEVSLVRGPPSLVSGNWGATWKK